MRPLRSNHHRPDLSQEFALREKGIDCIAGLDEAGRGAWAGPVIAAAVILPLDQFNLTSALEEVRDSKLLSQTKRLECLSHIQDVALSIGIGEAKCDEVDEIGIIAATRQAMQRAIQDLSLPPQHLLIDHIRLPDLEIQQTALPKGDRDVLSIAAASVIAKVTRDEIMRDFDNQFPGYGFSRHKGYGTHLHRKSLNELGPTLIHRKSFAPVANLTLPGISSKDSKE
jgi:ribonuclease HII